MNTPAQRWHNSERRYDPHPPRWQYPAGSWVRKVDSSGKLGFKHRHWNIGKALSGEWVRMERIGERILVYYCRTLVRELDLSNQRSTAVERWLESPDW